MNSVVATPTLSLCTLKPKNTLSFFTNYGTSDCKINGGTGLVRRNLVLTQCSTKPPSSSSENESRTILDAFFLGKALAEAVSERVESTLGEVLSTIGRLQAENQKQVEDFQEDVLERAKKAKEKAAREAMEANGLAPPRSSTIINTSVSNGFSSTVDSSSSEPGFTTETDLDFTN
ncbi:hypothetical protein ACFE04_029442 [Oxalis oulophora]